MNMNQEEVWLTYPENKPIKPGYYYTLYFNKYHNDFFYKALLKL